MPQQSPPDIFDRKRLAGLRRRAATSLHNDQFLWQYMADELTDRLACVTRNFEHMLIIGPIGRYAAQISQGSNMTVTHADFIEEDRLPCPPDSCDLIVSAGSLDQMNDLPGALIQMRRALRPDGLLLANLFGSGSLSALKAVMMEADGDRISAHIHPQIDLRAMADLLVRAGFALPVADIDRLSVRYKDWRRLVDDIRAMGFGNALAGARPFLGKDYPDRLSSAWAARAEADGKVTEQFQFLQISGWAPSPDQPKPAKRGSASVSLAKILGSGV